MGSRVGTRGEAGLPVMIRPRETGQLSTTPKDPWGLMIRSCMLFAAAVSVAGCSHSPEASGAQSTGGVRSKEVRPANGASSRIDRHAPEVRAVAAGRTQSDPSEPFMEHPNGEFDSAVAAMEDAVRRLRALRTWDRWITFGAQGEGSRPDSYEFAQIRMLRDRIDVEGQALDVPRIVEAARAAPAALVVDGSHYSIGAASPKEAALILDAIFRRHFGLRPFPDEGDDYAVGAEW